MELQFVGDIKAVRNGDKFTATGTLQSRRTGNYVTVTTQVDIPSLVAEAKAVYAAAREWLARNGQPVDEVPEAVLQGLGLSTRERGKLVREVSVARKALADEKKKQLVQAKLRAEAGRRLAERRQERKGYEENLAALRKQIEERDQNDSVKAQLESQAAQYESQLANLAAAQAQIADTYQTQIAKLQAMSAEQVDALPAAQETMEGLGWSFSGLFKKFKKALAVVFRSKIVKGLVRVAVATAGKMGWKVPGLGITARDAKTWMQLLSSAKAGNARSVAVINRIKVMARLGHKKAVKTFWLLRDMERVTPEVKAAIAKGDTGQQVSEQAASEGEPGSVPTALAGMGCIGMGAATSRLRVKVRCLSLDTQTGEWVQVPFTMAMGAKKSVITPKQRAAAAKRARLRAAKRNRGLQPSPQRNSPTAQSVPGGADPYAAQYAAQQGYDDYGAAPQYQPPQYDEQAYPQQAYPQQAYPQQAYDSLNYGDYSAAQQQPGFDPYSPASYGYDPESFATQE